MNKNKNVSLTESVSIYSQRSGQKRHGPNFIQRTNRTIYSVLSYCPPDPLDNFRSNTPYSWILFLVPLFGQVIFTMYLFAWVFQTAKREELKNIIFGRDE